MNSQVISNWIQITTGIALVAGLALVVWELQQAEKVARAQLSSDSFAQGAQVQTSLIGEEAGEAMAKACTDPESLTDGELMVLFSVYRSQLNLNRRLYIVEERSGLYEGDWRRYAPGAFANIFDTSVGRAWWKHVAIVDQQYRKVGDDILSELGPPDCQMKIGSVRREVESTAHSGPPP